MTADEQNQNRIMKRSCIRSHTVLKEKIKAVCAEIETLERELSHKRGYLDGLIYAVSELEKGVTSAPEKT